MTACKVAQPENAEAPQELVVKLKAYYGFDHDAQQS